MSSPLSEPIKSIKEGFGPFMVFAAQLLKHKGCFALNNNGKPGINQTGDMPAIC
jgi:hypothetical protein